MILGGAIAALAASDAEVLERNQRLLDRWRADPDHYQRLRDDLRAFWALPKKSRDRLRRLDRELHAADPATQERLWGVLERYKLWLERLPEEDRRRVLKAAEPAERLRLIRELREREWVERLPARLKTELSRMSAERWAARVAELRAQERAQREVWQRERWARVVPTPRPKKLEELPDAVQDFLLHTVVPQLSAAEKAELERTQGKWPDYPRAIHKFYLQHPVLLPRPGQAKATRFQELPEDVQKALGRRLKNKKIDLDDLARRRGKWPDYALLVAVKVKRPKNPLTQLGACRITEFPKPVQDAYHNRLEKMLNPQEKNQLNNAEGTWPVYPLRLREIAWRKNVQLPGITLPGPRELWESALKAPVQQPATAP
jgi:hypothetical protein